MKRRITTRRWFLIGSVGFLAAWLAAEVRVHVVNASGEDVQARTITSDEAWIEAKAGAQVYLGYIPYASLCSPPDRWLPEDFAGLEFKLADGSVVKVSREAFEKEAEYKGGWIYRFRG